jgi:hypothetical protein
MADFRMSPPTVRAVLGVPRVAPMPEPDEANLPDDQDVAGPVEGGWTGDPRGKAIVRACLSLFMDSFGRVPANQFSWRDHPTGIRITLSGGAGRGWRLRITANVLPDAEVLFRARWFHSGDVRITVWTPGPWENHLLAP